MASDPLSGAMDLMQRLPPSNMTNNLGYLLQLCPDIAGDLLDVIDQPLQVATCPRTGAEYILSEFNRDEDSHRSPWSNEYDPALPDGRVPPKHLRDLEVAANDIFKSYREQYYGSGVSSVYAFETDGGFAAAVLIKKVTEGQRGVTRGVWDAIHVIDVRREADGRFAYKLVSTVILSVITDGNKIDLCGSVNKQTEQVHALGSADDTRSHIVNIGNMVQDAEALLHSEIEQIYFGKTQYITNSLRTRTRAPAMGLGASLVGELASAMRNRAGASN